MHADYKLLVLLRSKLFWQYSLFLILLWGQANVAQAELSPHFSFKGFGTFAVTGTDTDAIGFRRDTSTARGATKSWSIPTDSRLGFQLDADFNEDFSATAQWVLRDRSGQFFEQNLDLAFLRWNISPDLYVRFGRVSPDVFMMTDHRNVGYAYPWMRSPHEFYGYIPIYHWDGIDITKKTEFDGGFLTLKVFGGYAFTQVNAPNKMLFDQGSAVFSTSLVYEKGDWTGRAAYSHIDLNHLSPKNPLEEIIASTPAIDMVWPGVKAFTPLLKFTGTTFNYSALGLKYDDGLWLGQAEASYVDSGNHPFVPNVASGYLSLGRRISSFTMYSLLGISKSFQRNFDIPNPRVPDPQLLILKNELSNTLNNNGIDEKSVSLGLRWDFYTNMALKAQWSHYWLGKNGTQNWVEDPVQSAPSEVNVFSVGMDFVF